MTNMELLVFAHKYLKQMTDNPAVIENNSMQSIYYNNCLRELTEKLKEAGINAEFPFSIGETVYLTHGYSEEIWERTDEENCDENITEIQKGIITTIFCSTKTKQLYAEIKLGANTTVTINTSDYSEKFTIHPTLEKAEAYVRWLSKDRLTVVYAINHFIYEYVSEGRKAFNIFGFVDYTSILGITPTGSKVIFTYDTDSDEVKMSVP